MTAVLWRIGTDTPDYTADDLSGEGAKRTGGRWNRLGSPVLYTSTSIALACLETLVHIDTDGLPLNRYLVRFELPDDLWTATPVFDPDTHVGWDAEPAGKVSLGAGDQWLASKASLLLRVPSVIVPEEWNVLVNPMHADLPKLSVRKVRRWTYDARLRRRP